MPVYHNFERWAAPEAFSAESVPGKWTLVNGVYGSTGGRLLYAPGADSIVFKGTPAPELRLAPGVRGWHDVYVRIYYKGHLKDKSAVFVGAGRDRALRVLRPLIGTETFADLYLGPRDLTDDVIRIANNNATCFLDSVRLEPISAEDAGERMRLPAADKEVAGILDFADAPYDYVPGSLSARECVKVHAEAGFTTIYWKSFSVRCEYQTRVGESRAAMLELGYEDGLASLLSGSDTLAEAVDEARNCGVKLAGWMRINNETADQQGHFHRTQAPVTAFHKAHPEQRERDKAGKPGPRLSFAYPEVREYLTRIAREILDHGTYGLMIDTLRHPPMARYDQPLVESFIKKTGQDPRQMDGDGSEEWLLHKSTAFTDLLADIRAMMDGAGFAALPIILRTHPDPWRCLRDGIDLDAILGKKLVTTIVAGHHCVFAGGHPAWFNLKDIQDAIKGRCRLLAQVMRGCEIQTALALADQAYQQNADGVAIYESNHVVTFPPHRDLVRQMRCARVPRPEVYL